MSAASSPGSFACLPTWRRRVQRPGDDKFMARDAHRRLRLAITAAQGVLRRGGTGDEAMKAAAEFGSKAPGVCGLSVCIATY